MHLLLRPHRVEVTAVPSMDYHHQPNFGRSGLNSSPAALQASMGLSRRPPIGGDALHQEQRIGFQLLANLIASAMRMRRTETVTSTQTTTSTSRTTVTNTAFILGCTTAPFSGTICPSM